jgi:hypothetical protein
MPMLWKDLIVSACLRDSPSSQEVSYRLCPGGESVFKYFMLTTRADLAPELLPCNVFQGEEIRIVENNMNSVASLCSLISSSAIMNGNEDIPSIRKDYPHLKTRFLEYKRKASSPMIGTKN